MKRTKENKIENEKRGKNVRGGEGGGRGTTQDEPKVSGINFALHG